MTPQTKSTRPQDANPSASTESPKEFYDETLSNLVQSWEVNVDAIDISYRVMTAIEAESESSHPHGQESSQLPSQFVPHLQDEYTGYPALTAEQKRRTARAIERGEPWGESAFARANPRLIDARAEEFKNRSIEMAIPHIDFKKHKPEAEALKLLTGEFARNNQVLPIKHETRRLWVAMRDARDTVAVDAVRMATGCLLQPMIAVPAELERAIAEAYGSLEPPQPPVPPAAIAASAPEPADEMSRLLRETLVEMRGMRGELSSLRREVAELRRDRSAAVPRPSTARLFPFAPPESASQSNQ